MVGNDGAISMASAMDGKRAPSQAIVQPGGDAIIAIQNYSRAALQSNSMISMVLRHEQTLFAQAQQSTACVANHIVEARLCRWLLRARDLSGSDVLPFTQEFLAQLGGDLRNQRGTHTSGRGLDCLLSRQDSHFGLRMSERIDVNATTR
jgi:hypothetical protein